MSEAPKERKPVAVCHCPYCDNEISSAGYPFCNSCGQQLQFCPHCGEATPRGAERCRYCGQPLKQKT